MALKLLLATLGVSFFLFYLKKFLSLNPEKLWDLDGMVERAFIIMTVRQGWFWLIPIIILLRITVYLLERGHLEFLKSNEPGMLFQRVKIKSELLVDLVLSPLCALLIAYFLP